MQRSSWIGVKNNLPAQPTFNEWAKKKETNTAIFGCHQTDQESRLKGPAIVEGYGLINYSPYPIEL